MIQHKKVEFVELFYDLVFVYAISQITGLIHHLHNGVVSVESFLAFAISLILYINTWIFQFSLKQTKIIIKDYISNIIDDNFMQFVT